MKKYFLISILAAFLNLLFLNCGKKDSANRSEAGIVGKILTVWGKVTVEKKAARIGMALHHGETVETGKKGIVEIILKENKSILRLKDSARLLMEETSNNGLRLGLERGWLAAYIKKRNVTVVSPTAMAAVRGTALFIKVEKPGSVYVCTCNGTVHYDADGIVHFADTAAHHNSFRFEKTGGKVKKKKAEMKYHGDDDINELARKVGSKVDWTRAE